MACARLILVETIPSKLAMVGDLLCTVQRESKGLLKALCCTHHAQPG